MTEDFYNLDAADIFLNIAVAFRHGFLLFFEQRLTLFGNQENGHHHKCYCNGDGKRNLPAVNDHNRNRDNSLYGRGYQIDKRALHKVADSSDVARKVAHDFAGLVLVKIADGKPLHMVEQLTAHIRQRFDRNGKHDSCIRIIHQRRNDIRKRHGEQRSCNLGKLRFQSPRKRAS